MELKQSKFKSFSIFFLIPLILSIALASISFFDLIQEAEGITAVGPKAAKSIGSKNAGIVCGDRLCSEDEPTGQSSSRTRHTPSTPLPKVSAEETEERLGLSPMIGIETYPVGAGERMSIEVKFEDPQGNNYQDVNYNIKVTQEGTVLLDEQGVYDQDGEMIHQTMPLPRVASSADPVDVEVEFLGFGTNEPLTGPIGEYETTHVVPEFGTIAGMILGISIISIIAVTTRSFFIMISLSFIAASSISSE